YYSGALALIGRDAGGTQTLDSPILIRTADIDAAGRLRVGGGATLVRHSDPHGEVAETPAKAAGVLAALGVRPGPQRAERGPRPGGCRRGARTEVASTALAGRRVGRGASVRSRPPRVRRSAPRPCAPHLLVGRVPGARVERGRAGAGDRPQGCAVPGRSGAHR